MGHLLPVSVIITHFVNRIASRSAKPSASSKSPSVPFARRNARRRRRPSASEKKQKRNARRRRKKRRRRMPSPPCPWVSVVPLSANKIARAR